MQSRDPCRVCEEHDDLYGPALCLCLIQVLEYDHIFTVTVILHRFHLLQGDLGRLEQCLSGTHMFHGTPLALRHRGCGPCRPLPVRYSAESETALRTVACRVLIIGCTHMTQSRTSYKKRRYDAMCIGHECALRDRISPVYRYDVIFHPENLCQSTHGYWMHHPIISIFSQRTPILN